MKLPNFLIIGAQKCGTTSLHDLLEKHPQTCMSDIKEVNFFTNSIRYNKGLPHYSTFFEGCDTAIATGESSPGYLCYPGVHKRIKEQLGTVKTVIILRDPIKRAFSQYWDNRRHLKESLTEAEIISQCLETEYKPGQRGYFSRGVYYPQVKRYIDTFGEKNVHIIVLEDLVKYQVHKIHKLYSYLEIDPLKGLQKLPSASNYSAVWVNPMYKYFFKHPKTTRYLPIKSRRLFFWGKKSSYKYELPNEDILNILREFYHPWNRKLENLLNIKFDKWI